VQRQLSRVTALQYFIGCMMPESANALQANAAIIEMIRLSLQVHRSSYGSPIASGFTSNCTSGHRLKPQPRPSLPLSAPRLLLPDLYPTSDQSSTGSIWWWELCPGCHATGSHIHNPQLETPPL